MSGYIYLPYALYSTDIIIKSLQYLISNNTDKDVANLVVKNHPLAKNQNSKKHLKIIKND